MFILTPSIYTTMEKPLHRILIIALLLVSGHLLTSHSVLGQTITMIPNPDNGGGYTDRFNSGSFEPLVEMDNVLYGRYVDGKAKGRLVKFDGNKLTLIPNPDNNSGVFGNMVAYNHVLYTQYAGDKIAYLAKYDGTNLTLISNPDSGPGFYGGSILTVFNSGLYARYLDNNNTFHLVRIDNTPVNLPFGFTSLENVSCNPATGNKFSFSFTPRYVGSTEQPITFSVVNELEPTTSPGPYQLSLYKDNPVITLKATQTGSSGEARYEVNWVQYCGFGARKAADESDKGLNVMVLPNPSLGQTAEVAVYGVAGQSLDFQVENEQGVAVSHLRIDQANETEHAFVRLGTTSGIYFLRINTPTQTKTVKVIRR